MKKIGFKNFRRFKELEPLELGEITLMVGKNNSGKSTLIKAVLLVLDYLKNQQSDTFSFANETLNDVNIVTFERAKSKLQDEPVIDFYFEIENYQIELSISGDDKWTYANVDTLTITDINLKLEFVIDYLTQTVRISRQAKEKTQNVQESENKKELLEKIAQQKAELEGLNRTSREALKIISQINSLSEKIKEQDKLNAQEIKEKTIEFDYSQEYDLNVLKMSSTGGAVLEEIVRDFIALNHEMRAFYIGKREEERVYKGLENKLTLSEREVLYEADEKIDFDNYIPAYLKESDKMGMQLREGMSSELYTNSENDNELLEQITALEGDKNAIQNSMSEFVKLINTKKIFYLGANPLKQRALFNLRDKENSLAQAIHQFYQLKIQEGDPEYLFVEEWMDKFEIGDSFEINFISGEAYQCRVVDRDRDVKTHLSDMGMGSLQLMQLFFKIASILRQNKLKTRGLNLIVEEPEISLHPFLQSKLADFFYEVNEEYGIKFIVETHSEYIIKNSQVIGVEKDLLINQEYNPNPFKIYYFHIKDGPYEMTLDSSGRFIKKFGEGFTDVSRKLTRKLL